MKKQALLLCTLLAASVAALAQTPPPTSPFEQHKAATIAKLQARIARDQALVSCLQSAQNRAAVKACKLASRPVR